MVGILLLERIGAFWLGVAGAAPYFKNRGKRKILRSLGVRLKVVCATLTTSKIKANARISIVVWVGLRLAFASP